MNTEQDQPEAAEPAQPDELQTLREHNKKLLAELKAARAEAKTASEAAQRAQEHLKRWAIDQPLQAIAKGLSPHPETFARLLRDHIDVTLDDAGEPRVTNKAGEPLTLTKGHEIVPVGLRDDELRQWIDGPDGPAELTGLRIKAQGCGALGSGPYRASLARPADKKPAEPTAPERPAYGLR